MARNRLRQNDAFGLPSRASRTANRSLYHVALDVIETGDLPDKDQA